MTRVVEPAKPARATLCLRAMKKIVFTQQLRRFTEAPELESHGLTVRAVLEDAFLVNPRLRSYVLDDQSDLRQHVVVFINGERLRDRSSLGNELPVDCTGVLWAGTLPGGLFRSEDRGASWRLIRSLREVPQRREWFGGGYDALGIHSISVDPHTAWLVPARAHMNRVPVDAALAVTRTCDGGKTFQRLSSGLPQKDCYDLVYRHGLTVADDGATLVMGSTTGGQWISENGGDT